MDGSRSSRREDPRAYARGRGDDPAQVAPAPLVADQQRQVPRTRAVGVHVDLGSVDRPDSALGRALRQLHRAGERVVVGQRERLMAQLARAHRKLLRQGYAIQERVGRVAVQLHVWGCGQRLPLGILGEPAARAQVVEDDHVAAPRRPRAPSSAGAGARRSTSGPRSARTRAGTRPLRRPPRPGRRRASARERGEVRSARGSYPHSPGIGASTTRRSGTRESGSTQTARSAASLPARVRVWAIASPRRAARAARS